MTSGNCHYCLKSFSCLNSKQVCCQPGKIPQGLVHYGETFKREELFVHSFPLQFPPPHTHRTSTTHTGERQIWDWQQRFQCLFFLCLFSFNLLHSTDPHILDCAVHSLGFMLLESYFCSVVCKIIILMPIQQGCLYHPPPPPPPVCVCVRVCVCVGGGGACMHALRMVSKNKILCFINTLLFIIKKTNRGTGCLPWSCILEFGIGLQAKNERCFVCTTERQDGHLAHA